MKVQPNSICGSTTPPNCLGHKWTCLDMSVPVRLSVSAGRGWAQEWPVPELRSSCPGWSWAETQRPRRWCFAAGPWGSSGRGEFPFKEHGLKFLSSLQLESGKQYREFESDVGALWSVLPVEIQRSLWRTLEYHSGGTPGVVHLSISLKGEVEFCKGKDQQTPLISDASVGQTVEAISLTKSTFVDLKWENQSICKVMW